MSAYENPQIPEGINVSPTHPLKDFALLLGGVSALIVVAVLALSFAAGYLVLIRRQAAPIPGFVVKLAVSVLDKAARSALEKAGLTDADIDWLIPHQANIRIMQSTARKLKLSMDKVVVTVDQHGNTSAASIPLALDHGVRSGQVKKGQTVLLEGVGGGFTWGAVLLKM